MNEEHFRDYHLLLDQHAEQIFAMTGDVAERARKIGGTTPRSISDISEHQCLKKSNVLNIEVVRSVWRRVKKGIKVRDLKPVKDVKGGGGVKGESKPSTGGTGTTGTASTWDYVPKRARKS